MTLTIDDEKNSILGCTIACTLNVWFLSIGFTVVFAALYSKARRINIIMEKASKCKRAKVMPKDVILPFVLLLLTNVIILITWTVFDPLVFTRRAHDGTDDWNREFSFYGVCSSKHSDKFVAVLIVVNLIALVLALYETYKTRDLITEFNESAYIGVVFVCICKFFNSFTMQHIRVIFSSLLLRSFS